MPFSKIQLGSWTITPTVRDDGTLEVVVEHSQGMTWGMVNDEDNCTVINVTTPELEEEWEKQTSDGSRTRGIPTPGIAVR